MMESSEINEVFLLPKWSSLVNRPDMMRRLENALRIEQWRISSILSIDCVCPLLARVKWLKYVQSN